MSLSRCLIFLLIIPFESCQSSQKLLFNAHWIVGTWEMKTDQGSLYETWRKGDSRSMYAKSYILQGTDTLLFETVHLQARSGKLYYIVDPPGGQQGATVSFESTSIRPDGFMFENKQHDFPQVISYRQVRPDSLEAEISGISNGIEQLQKFPMNKIK